MLDEVFRQAKEVYRLLNGGNLQDAKALALSIEASQAAYSDPYEKTVCLKYVAGCLIDIGTASSDEDMVNRGTLYCLGWIGSLAPEKQLADDLYNLANGYSSLWKFHAKESLAKSTDAEAHRLARHYYREAIKRLEPRHHADGLACQIWTNYGNTLDSIGRGVEAINAYDAALRVNPNMGMALGNKGIALSNSALSTSGHTHLFFLESISLLKKALEQDIDDEASAAFAERLELLEKIQSDHHEMKPEEVKFIEPITDFHQFLCKYCAKHELFLNPVTFLGEPHKAYYGDPVFISTMYAAANDNNKFERYITFLNEIKEDYVLGRYFLAQSQYISQDIDAIDEGVNLYYPLDYSLYSSYLQLLKTANKQAVAVLDKVAYFIYDYCDLKTPQADRVSFRQIWGGNDTMRQDLQKFTSPYLFALFTIAKDVSKKGDWEYIYETRDALTHRFLVIHDFQISSQANADIPRIDLSTFLDGTVLAFKIARAAIMYLILFVEDHERRTQRQNTGKTMPIYGVQVDKNLSYRPR